MIKILFSLVCLSGIALVIVRAVAITKRDHDADVTGFAPDLDALIRSAAEDARRRTALSATGKR